MKALPNWKAVADGTTAQAMVPDAQLEVQSACFSST